MVFAPAATTPVATAVPLRKSWTVAPGSTWLMSSVGAVTLVM
jgi:hypothetical protein